MILNDPKGLKQNLKVCCQYEAVLIQVLIHYVVSISYILIMSVLLGYHCLKNT